MIAGAAPAATGHRLFRTLKQERVIFRDPTRGIVVSAVLILPKNIPSDRLRGLLDQAHRPVTKLVLVLAAVHGLRPTGISRTLLEDLDLSAGRLAIRPDDPGWPPDGMLISDHHARACACASPAGELCTLGLRERPGRDAPIPAGVAGPHQRGAFRVVFGAVRVAELVVDDGSPRVPILPGKR